MCSERRWNTSSSRWMRFVSWMAYSPPRSRVPSRRHAVFDGDHSLALWDGCTTFAGLTHRTLGRSSGPCWPEGPRITLQAIHPPATTSNALPRVWAAPIATPAAIKNPVGA